MSQYLGLDVLDIAQPNRSGPFDDLFRRRLRAFDNETGAADVQAMGAAPKAARPWLWTEFTRAEAAAMTAFIEARRGRAIPFWMPSYQHDLTLAAPLAFGADVATVDWVGYTEHVWTGEGRRFIAIYSPAAGLSYHRIIDAGHAPGAETETITIDPSAGFSYPADTLIMFLKLCRLDTDEISLGWYGPTICEATLPVLEIPLEEPA